MSKERKYWRQKMEPFPFWLKAPLILLGLCLLFIIMSYGRFILMPLAIIPFVGSILGALPAVIYAFLFGDSLLLPLLVTMVFTVVQLTESSFITPKIVGSKVSINPFVAIVVLLIGGELWGIAGMILFIPLIGILRVGFSQVQGLEPYGYLLGNNIDYKESERKKDRRWMLRDPSSYDAYTVQVDNQFWSRTIPIYW